MVKRLGLTDSAKIKILQEAIAELQEQEKKKNSKFKPKHDFSIKPQ